MGADEERARLRSVYGSYDGDEAVRARWGDSPGNRLILAERDQAIEQVLREGAFWPLGGRRILEIGCGGGANLPVLLRNGAVAHEVHAVDLVVERLKRAQLSGTSARLCCADGTALPYSTESFDLVLLFTVMSSILDPGTADIVASEARRMLRIDSGGPAGVLWYDMALPNPWNRHIRRIAVRDLRRLFPDLRTRVCRSLTLLPPLARLLGVRAPWAYGLLARVPLLLSHRLCLLCPEK